MPRTLRVGVEIARRAFHCEQSVGFADFAGSYLVGSFYDQLTSPRTCTFRVRACVLSGDGNELR